MTAQGQKPHSLTGAQQAMMHARSKAAAGTDAMLYALPWGFGARTHVMCPGSWIVAWTPFGCHSSHDL